MPDLRIQRIVNPERCRIVYSMTSVLFNNLLSQTEASDASQLSDDFLRQLCHRASAASMEQQIEELIEKHQTEVAMVVGHGADGSELELSSKDLGYDLLKRFAPQFDEEQETLCDPTYSPVDFELRVFDPAVTDPRDLEIGHAVLSRTLYPPDLAQA